MAFGMEGCTWKTFVAILAIVALSLSLYAHTRMHLLLFLFRCRFLSLSLFFLLFLSCSCCALAIAPSRSVSLIDVACGTNCRSRARREWVVVFSGHRQRPVGKQLQYQHIQRQSRNATHGMRANLSCQLRIQTIWKWLILMRKMMNSPASRALAAIGCGYGYDYDCDYYGYGCYGCCCCCYCRRRRCWLPLLLYRLSM